MPFAKLEQLGLQVNFTPRERAYFDKLTAELLALFNGRNYVAIKADEDAQKLKLISEKLAQMENFVKMKKIPRIEVDPAVLQLKGEIVIPATLEKFKVADRFVADNSASARVKIARLSQGFLAFFGEMIVDECPGSKLSYYKQQRRLYDADMISTFGGERVVETSLAEIWQLLEKQKTGGDGILLTDGHWNVFYVRGKYNLSVIRVSWEDDGWCLSVDGIGNGQLYESGRIFVRDFYFT